MLRDGKLTKYIIIVLLALIFLYFASCLGIALYALTRKKTRTEETFLEILDDPSKSSQHEHAKICIERIKILNSLKTETLCMKSFDGLNLKAWFLQPEEPSKRFVICIHGYKCNGPDECSHLLPFYRNTLKYNYLLPDLRAHGRSEGKYIGFGALDAKDIKLWINLSPFFWRKHNLLMN